MSKNWLVGLGAGIVFGGLLTGIYLMAQNNNDELGVALRSFNSKQLSTTTATTGYALFTNGIQNYWAEVSAGATDYLSQIGDVSTTSLATNDILYYDGSNWVTTATTSWSSGVGGSGTLNTIPKFTPDGTTLGDSLITDTGSVVTVGDRMVVTGTAFNDLAVSNAGGTSGMYLSGNNWVFGGSASVKLITNGGYQTSIDGSASAPVYSWDSDSNTGLFRATDDTLGLTSGGIEFMRLSETTQDVMVFNENGVDIDFRVESDNIANNFFIDGSTGEIQIGGDVTGLKFYPAFTYATTSWSGSTTIPLGVAYNAQTWNGVKCFTDTGTLFVEFGDGTNAMNDFQASTTVGTITLSSNNTFTAGEKRYVDIGTPASSPTEISCTVSYQDD